MVPDMGARRHEGEIFQPVVERVAVDVVDDVFFGDRPVRGFPDVAMQRFPPRPVVDAAMPHRAEWVTGIDAVLECNTCFDHECVIHSYPTSRLARVV